MLFIEEIMKKIWEKEYCQYLSYMEEADQIPLAKLYDSIREELDRMDTVVRQDKKITMIALATSGCPHHVRKDGFYGCSMCDYDSCYMKSLARINVLKQKNPGMYGDIIRRSFKNAREKIGKPSVVELITGYDCLNSEEIPEDVYQELIVREKIFKRKVRPAVSIFEARATSITLDKLLAWKENLGKKVIVELGIEVANDWIRNHWINKAATNQEIKHAVDVIHQAGCEVSANILIGVPGCTEDQSIFLFKESVRWLSEIGCDHILCSPLCRKNRTLQEFLYQRGKDNSRLCQYGIVHGEHTGMPYVHTVIRALYETICEYPRVAETITLSPANFPIYYKELEMLAEADSPKKASEIGIVALKAFEVTGDRSVLDVALNQLMTGSLAASYQKLLKKQSAVATVLDSFCIWAEETAKILREVPESAIDQLRAEAATYQELY